MIAALAERDGLGLLPGHPPRIHFAYLDPDHRAAGGRWHDSATVGDGMAPAYRPHVIVVSENKDTAIHFPALPNAISVEGDGFGAAAAAGIAWLATAPHLIYWGGMDAYGFESVDNFRREGLPVRTILMDQTTYERYEIRLSHRRAGKTPQACNPQTSAASHGHRKSPVRASDRPRLDAVPAH
ncbi:Wadjet anti-phage system protein JetD domain-containing protein [Sphaerisporangium rhizosphaerae]|uniref:Wadjet anti-phage system protein JetD domain-containing protein n=1 Tax=Sphaerisporangium rhizosphaerae TaxID=2269375 RepID=A0ABW2PLD4_9ACTN